MSVNYYEPPAPPPVSQVPPTPAPSPQPRSTSSFTPVTPKPSSRLRRIFGGFGAAVTTLRNTLANILFLIILLLIIAAISGKATPPLPNSFALQIAPSGILVDQRSYIDTASLLLSDTNPNDSETVVSELVTAINTAKDDNRVSLLVLEPGRLIGGGISKLNEIGQALENFQSSGKKVIAISDNYSQDQYYLASFADEIYLHDMGVVEITGYSRYMNYYKSALDKLGVTIHAFRTGKYKDYLEPYLRDDMSAESREHNAQWINELWASYTHQVEQQRGLPSGTLSDYVNNLDAHLALTDGSHSKLALEKGLIDYVVPRQQMMSTIVAQVGQDDNGKGYKGVNVHAYLADTQKHKNPGVPKIGVIVASGSIVDGHQPDGRIGSESMLELLFQARQDDDLKGLVIRIDSGGGSAFASELIRSEIIALRDKNIPVYISMGSVAASGGYWIATAGDKIWAQPTTITGSIGVFGAFPTLEKSLEKIGIYSDGVGTTELAGSMRLDRPLSHKASKVVQQSVDNIYQRFITLVADARGQDVNAIDAIAQGRVWTGKKAKEIGLVDELGTLTDVIAAVAEAAQLNNFQVQFLRRQLSPKEELLRSLAQGHAGALLPKSWLGSLDSLSVLNDLAPVVKPLQELKSLNDPQDIYVHCLDCVAP